MSPRPLTGGLNHRRKLRNVTGIFSPAPSALSAGRPCPPGCRSYSAPASADTKGPAAPGDSGEAPLIRSLDHTGGPGSLRCASAGTPARGGTTGAFEVQQASRGRTGFRDRLSPRIAEEPIYIGNSSTCEDGGPPHMEGTRALQRSREVTAGTGRAAQAAQQRARNHVARCAGRM